MPTFVRNMLVLGLLVLLIAMAMMWRSEETGDLTPQPARALGSGKPVGTSTLSHGGPASTANQSDSRDSVSQR